LVKATDPVALVLQEIPRVYLDNLEEPQRDILSPDDRQAILHGLKLSIHELDSYKSRIAEEVTAILHKVFPGTPGDQEESLIGTLRRWVGTLASAISEYLEDPQCAGFLTRIMSNYEDDRTLVESLAALVTGRSMAYWDDSFLRQFELGTLLIYKKITETDALLKSRKEQESERSDSSSWTVRIEQGGQAAGELVVTATEVPPKKILEAKKRIAKVLSAKTRRLTLEERQRVLVELLKEGLMSGAGEG
jgi:hypothetical protein